MNGPPGPSPSGPPRCRVATRCRSGPSASAGTSSHRRETPVSQTASVSPSSPDWLAYIGQAAISVIYGPLAAAAYRPDTALVNYYDPGPRPWGGAVRSRLLMPYAAFTAAKAAGASWNDRTPGDPAPRPGQNMRIHHDNGESISDLAVSLSLGDRCSFRLSPGSTPAQAIPGPASPAAASTSQCA